jgi:hypothetical protein
MQRSRCIHGNDDRPKFRLTTDDEALYLFFASSGLDGRQPKI